ncbi:aquaporin-10b isoform X2 [Hypomesus transpacificus]|uniref:aquaporin-10b isoform X2 n=1 Tax=Hypomesus transpacificus TaxID=137520 RepID=UPI001F0724A7|nr:aquaporin-10b isoform X2 [Hypomesus transpacificus]
MDRLLKKCCIRNSLVKKCLAECLGVFIIILFGCGSVAQVTTSENKNGQYLSINLGFALGTTFGIYVSRGVSGAHLNPAVTLSLCFLGRHPWFDLPFYVFSQVLGGFLGAATVALQYYDAIMFFGGGKLTVTGPTATAGIFTTYPADYLSLWGGVIDQEFPGPSWSGASPGGGRGPVHWGVHGLQQRLLPEPGQGLGAPSLHLFRWLGWRGVQCWRWVVVGAAGSH